MFWKQFLVINMINTLFSHFIIDNLDLLWICCSVWKKNLLVKNEPKLFYFELFVFLNIVFQQNFVYGNFLSRNNYKIDWLSGLYMLFKNLLWILGIFLWMNKDIELERFVPGSIVSFLVKSEATTVKG